MGRHHPLGPLFVYKPCEWCGSRLRRTLADKGAEAMARDAGPMMRACVECRKQLPVNIGEFPKYRLKVTL